ncbi:MAG TPA: serine/threonine-protein kinase, partial [Polyangiaceae bacterium]|nr:serine/threonine-protein kinase [Polyangiaceae bacterium]
MLLERYEVGERLAESERNTIRRARRISDGARLIIKTSTRDYPSVREVQKLEFEYHILNRVKSPGIIAAVEIERQSGRVAIVLEDFGGERLAELVARGLPLSEFFPLASSIVRAIGEVHARGVMHKDINPGNVLINPSTREIKLIDFSIASELEREQLDATAVSALEGTLPYISPEQTGRMNREVDYRTDYYSLGVTLFELLTGSLPFSAPD